MEDRGRPIALPSRGIARELLWRNRLTLLHEPYHARLHLREVGLRWESVALAQLPPVARRVAARPCPALGGLGVRALSRLARARLADSLCALALPASARVGGLKSKPAKVLLTSPECARHAWLSCFGWGRCGASLRAERCAPAIDFAHSWPRKKAQALGRQIAGFARAWGVLACISIIYQPISRV